MIDTKQLIADFEDCIGWPYKSPGTNDERGIDCSGMFVRAFRRQGGSIYHGSNTIWRKHLREKGAIASAKDLRPGMAVFKWKEQTPAKFSDNLGDFCHIGLVTSVSPLRIVHASTEGMKVKADSKIGKWKHWGVLSATGLTVDGTVSRPTLRKGSKGADVTALQEALQSAGFDLAIDGVFGPETQKCVRSFQRRQGLESDGIVGPLTWSALGGEANA